MAAKRSGQNVRQLYQAIPASIVTNSTSASRSVPSRRGSPNAPAPTRHSKNTSTPITSVIKPEQKSTNLSDRRVRRSLLVDEPLLGAGAAGMLELDEGSMTLAMVIRLRTRDPCLHYRSRWPIGQAMGGSFSAKLGWRISPFCRKMRRTRIKTGGHARAGRSLYVASVPAEFRELVSGPPEGPRRSRLRALLALAEVPYALAMRYRNRRYDRGKAESHRRRSCR